MRRNLSLKILILSFATTLLSATITIANPKMYGAWQNPSSGERIDFLDGFKSGQGPILFVDKDGGVATGSWKTEKDITTINRKFGSSVAEVTAEGELKLSQPFGRSEKFIAIKTTEDTPAINLKDSASAFIAKLQEYQWLTGMNGREATFKATFNSEAGVMELSTEGNLNGLTSWGVASGVIKLGDNVIVEARVTDRYFVGLDNKDKFLVFRALQPAESRLATDVAEQREKFFDNLLTGEWESTSWGSKRTHKFRPVYGELAGIFLTIVEGNLREDFRWEYSPATGALKIGGTEYVGAMIVNDTLALLDKQGNQRFYNRLANQNTKRYTLTDVKVTPLNEKSLARISAMLAPQFQADDNIYSFEFMENGRTGYIHRWKSVSFAITGETFSSEMFGKSGKLYQVEDVVIFDEGQTFKMDLSPSRLRPKTDAESITDAANQAKMQQDFAGNRLILRLTTVDGMTQDIPLPVADFGDLNSITVIRE